MALPTLQTQRPVNISSITRPLGEEFNYGTLQQKNIYDIGLSPLHINKIMSYKYRNSYIPYMFDLFGDRVKAIPYESQSWRDAKDPLTDGKVIGTVGANGSFAVIDIKVAGYQDSLEKEWWFSGTEIVSATTGRHFNIINAVPGTFGTWAQTLTIRPYDNAAVVVSGGQSVDFPDSSRFGEIAVDRDFSGGILTGRNADFDFYTNYMSEVNNACKIDRDAYRNRIMMSFDDNPKGNQYYVTQVEDQMRMTHFAMANNKFLHGVMNQNANIKAKSGAGLFSQIHSDCIEPYTSLTGAKLRNGLKRWGQLSPNDPPKTALALMGSEAFNDFQTVSEGMQPFMLTPRGFQKLEKDGVVGQEFKFFYWNGIMISAVQTYGLDSVNVQAKRSTVTDSVSEYSHDILLLDMGMKNGQEKGSETGDYKINVYCPQAPDGSKDFLQVMTVPGSIDGNGNPITGNVVSTNDFVTRQMVSRFMVNVEDKYSVFNFTRR